MLVFHQHSALKNVCKDPYKNAFRNYYKDSWKESFRNSSENSSKFVFKGYKDIYLFFFRNYTTNSTGKSSKHSNATVLRLTLIFFFVKIPLKCCEDSSCNLSKKKPSSFFSRIPQKISLEESCRNVYSIFFKKMLPSKFMESFSTINSRNPPRIPLEMPAWILIIFFQMFFFNFRRVNFHKNSIVFCLFSVRNFYDGFFLKFFQEFL